MRWMIPVVVDCILSDGNLPVLANGFSRVWIDVEAGEVAAGDIQTNAMALFEHVAYRVENDIDFVHLSRLHHLAMFAAIAIPRAHDAVHQIQCIPQGIVLAGRIDIDELGGEVSIRRR